MATKPINNMVRQVGWQKSVGYPVDKTGTNDFNAGDLVALDAGVLKAATDALAAKFVGVAKNSNYLSLYTKDNVAQKVYEAQVEVLVGQVHFFKTTAAETYVHLTPVYVGADAQTVTMVDPGSAKIIGYCIMRPDQASVVGAAGVYVDVLIIPQLPVAGIA